MTPVPTGTIWVWGEKKKKKKTNKNVGTIRNRLSGRYDINIFSAVSYLGLFVHRRGCGPRTNIIRNICHEGENFKWRVRRFCAYYNKIELPPYTAVPFIFRSNRLQNILRERERKKEPTDNVKQRNKSANTVTGHNAIGLLIFVRWYRTIPVRTY